jgi:N-acetylglucosamine-6-sulfatase
VARRGGLPHRVYRQVPQRVRHLRRSARPRSPGWDRWIGYEGGAGEQKQKGAFKVNEGSKIHRIGDQHDTDYFARKAEDYIRNRKAGNPWFLVVSTNAPHEPAEASGRNEGTYAGQDMPRTPGFNEADMSDKASVWRRNPRLTDECDRGYRIERGVQCLPEIDEIWRDRMESLQDFDQMMGRLLTALSD